MNREAATKEIWNLHRKADQTRSMHSMILEKFVWIQRIALAYITVGSAVSAMLIFAKIPGCYYLIPAFLSASLFIVGLLMSAFEINRRISERQLAVNLWGDWIRQAQKFGNVDVETLSDDESSDRLTELNEKYRKVMDDTPGIPDSQFLRLKRRHLIKVEVSKALDGNPFLRVGKIKMKLAKEKK